MKSSTLIILSISIVLSTADNDKKDCTCMLLKDCQVLFSKFLTLRYQNSKNLSGFLKNLMNNGCGFEGRDHLVCCPNDRTKSTNGATLYNGASSNPQRLKRIRNASVIQSKENNVDPLSECGRAIENRNLRFGNQTELSEFPWLALLEYEKPDGSRQFLCGGVLISNQHILTAAHCIKPKLVSVRLGEHDINKQRDCLDDFCADFPVDIAVDKMIPRKEKEIGISHRMSIGRSSSEYGDELDYTISNSHDLALIKLKEKVKYTHYIQRICLPEGNPQNKKFVVAGWGKSSAIPNAKGFSKKLASQLTHNQSVCEDNRQLPFFDSDYQICAAAQNRFEKPCIADSGGPLMALEKKENGLHRYTVFGISFMDHECERPGISGLPGVFTDVYNHREWIERHMRD